MFRRSYINDVPISTDNSQLHNWDAPTTGLYELLEGLIEARYSSHKLKRLNQMNTQLAKLRYQTRLLFDFELLSVKRYEFASLQLRGIGSELGGWVKQQQH